MKKLLSTLFVSFFAVAVFGQQLPYYGQYFVNPFLINPAYAGQKTTTNAFLDVRQNWVGFAGSPFTQNLNVEGPVANGKIGLGANLYNDVENVLGRTGGALSGAYHLQLERNQFLSFGLSLGMVQSRIFFENIRADDPTEASIFNNNPSATYFDAGLGVVYRWKGFEAGFSALQFSGTRFTYQNEFDESVLQSQLIPTYMLMVRYKLGKERSKMEWEPTLLLRSAGGLPTQIDLGLTAIYNKMVWLNATYRNDIGINVSLGVEVENKVVIGYGYEMGSGAIANQSQGSHEIIVGFRFGGNTAKKPKKKTRFKAEKVMEDDTRKLKEKIEQLEQKNEELQRKMQEGAE